MIEKLKRENVIEYFFGEPVIIGVDAPNNQKLMEKINEIIDVVNRLSAQDDDLR